MIDLVPRIDENKFMQQNKKKKNGQNHVHVLIVLGST